MRKKLAYWSGLIETIRQDKWKFCKIFHFGATLLHFPWLLSERKIFKCAGFLHIWQLHYWHRNSLKHFSVNSRIACEFTCYHKNTNLQRRLLGRGDGRRKTPRHLGSDPCQATRQDTESRFRVRREQAHNRIWRRAPFSALPRLHYKGNRRRRPRRRLVQAGSETPVEKGTAVSGADRQHPFGRAKTMMDSIIKKFGIQRSA